MCPSPKTIKLVTVLFAALAFGACDKFSATPASLDDVGKVVEALRAAGCTGLLELDVEGDGYEAEGVTCGDGETYDMKIDKSFTITSKRTDML